MNNQPAPIDHTAVAEDLTETAAAAFRQLSEAVINLHVDGWAAARINAIEAGDASAEIRTSFGKAAAECAVTFADPAGSKCLAEFKGDEDALQSWIPAIWSLCAVTLDKDGGRSGSVAHHDAILAGRAVVIVQSSYSRGTFYAVGEMHSHGAATHLFTVRSSPKKPTVH